MRNAIGVILGRRSGTSTMAKWLFDNGFPMREPLDTRYFKNQPQGHYESWEARDWDAKILHRFSMTAGVPGMVPFLKFEPLRHWFDDHAEPFIVKEPNVNLVWPVWLRTATEHENKRDLVGVWCRRSEVEQVSSLVRAYNMDEQDAKWCVKMYEASALAACNEFPVLQVWLDDENREQKAADWFIEHGLGPQMPGVEITKEGVTVNV